MQLYDLFYIFDFRNIISRCVCNILGLRCIILQCVFTYWNPDVSLCDQVEPNRDSASRAKPCRASVSLAEPSHATPSLAKRVIPVGTIRWGVGVGDHRPTTRVHIYLYIPIYRMYIYIYIYIYI